MTVTAHVWFACQELLLFACLVTSCTNPPQNALTLAQPSPVAHTQPPTLLLPL